MTTPLVELTWAKRLHGLGFGDLPPDVVAVAETSFAGTVACIVAGRGIVVPDSDNHPR